MPAQCSPPEACLKIPDICGMMLHVPLLDTIYLDNTIYNQSGMLLHQRIGSLITISSFSETFLGAPNIFVGVDE